MRRAHQHAACGVGWERVREPLRTGEQRGGCARVHLMAIEPGPGGELAELGRDHGASTWERSATVCQRVRTKPGHGAPVAAHACSQRRVTGSDG